MTTQVLNMLKYGTILSTAKKDASNLIGKQVSAKNHADTEIVELTQQIQQQLVSGMKDLQNLLEYDLGRFTQSANGFISYDNSVVFGQEYGPKP